MGEIYSVARHTIIFLGPSNPEYESILESISDTGSVPEPHFEQDSLAKAAEDILVHPWFERVWILQELVLSVDPWVQIGRFRMRWDLFVQCMRGNYTTFQSSLLSHLKAMTQIRTKYLIGKYSSAGVKERRAIDIFELLKLRRGIGATDPRDLVYAQLGMLQPSVRSKIVIDYSKSVAQVYEDISRHICESNDALPFLEHVEYLEPDSRRHGLPSWVPHWSVAMRIQRSKWHEHLMEFEAERLTILHGAPGVLGILGRYHGTVIDIFPGASSLGNEVEEALEWLHEISSLKLTKRMLTCGIELSRGVKASGIEAFLPAKVVILPRSEYLEEILKHIPLPVRNSLEAETPHSMTRILFLVFVLRTIVCTDSRPGKICFMKNKKDMGICRLPEQTLVNDIVATLPKYKNIFVFRANSYEAESRHYTYLREAFTHSQRTAVDVAQALDIKCCDFVNYMHSGNSVSKVPSQLYSIVTDGSSYDHCVESVIHGDYYMPGFEVLLALH